jgi:hypothetical protein
MSAYQDGRNDAYNHEYDPPGDSLLETFSNETGRFYDHQRAEYEQGRGDMKNEMEHGHRK